MQPRDHHYGFAHRLLPRYAFESPDKLLGELSGPMHEGFLMFLWEQAGEACSEKLKPVDVGERPGSGRQDVLSLSVLSIDDVGGWKIVMLGMPPTAAPGEAMYVAIARNAFGVRYFVYEHATSPGQGNMGEWRADGSRIGYGPHAGVMPEDFVRALGHELGLAGAAATGNVFSSNAAFGGGGFPMGGGAPAMVAPEAAAGIAAIGKWVGLLLLIRGFYSLFSWLFWQAAPRVVHDFDTIDALSSGIRGLRGLVSLALAVVLLIWVYRVFAALRGKTKYSPGIAVGGWFIPLANFVLPPMILRDAWRVVSGGQPEGRVIPWWIFYLLNAALEGLYRSPAFLDVLYGGSLAAFSMLTSLVATGIDVLAFLLLYPFVQDVTRRLTGGR